MALPKTIALDGPAGSGKTTVAFLVAQRLGYLFVDTGAFYRAVTLAAIRSGLADDQIEQIGALARQVRLDIRPSLQQDDRQYTVLLNDEDVTWAIRDLQVEARVSPISAIPAVRDALNQRYRELTRENTRVLMVGRDIGTVVLPDADLKIYLDASLNVRAERRYKQALAAGKSPDLDSLRDAMAGRDRHDSQREVAPLRSAQDAAYINSDDEEVDAVVARILALIGRWDSTHPT